MLDFSNAPDQREFGNGPVPAGSIVIVQMEVLQPHESKRAIHKAEVDSLDGQTAIAVTVHKVCTEYEVR